MATVIEDYYKFHEIRITPDKVFVSDRRFEGNRSNSKGFNSYKDAIKYINKMTNRG